MIIAGVPDPDRPCRCCDEYVEQGGNLVIAAGGEFDPPLWTEAAWLDGAVLPAPLDPTPVGRLPDRIARCPQTVPNRLRQPGPSLFLPRRSFPRRIAGLVSPPCPFLQSRRCRHGPKNAGSLCDHRAGEEESRGALARSTRSWRKSINRAVPSSSPPLARQPPTNSGRTPTTNGQRTQLAALAAGTRRPTAIAGKSWPAGAADRPGPLSGQPFSVHRSPLPRSRPGAVADHEPLADLEHAGPRAIVGLAVRPHSPAGCCPRLSRRGTWTPRSRSSCRSRPRNTPSGSRWPIRKVRNGP